MMRRIIFCAACALCVLLTARPTESATDAATALYIATVASMQALPEPPFVSYQFVQQDPTAFALGLVDSPFEGVLLHMGMIVGSRSWGVIHRTRDFANIIVDGDGNHRMSMRPFFDPTWYSGYHDMREGEFFPPEVQRPKSSRVPTPHPLPSNDPHLKTIAQEQVVRANLYDVRDLGPARCPNGDEGRALAFTPRGSPDLYSLTAAVVDLAPDLFCVLRFASPPREGHLIWRDDQYYGMMGGYWLRTGGMLRIGSAQINYQFEDMTFPDTAPDDFFITPPQKRAGPGSRTTRF